MTRRSSMTGMLRFVRVGKRCERSRPGLSLHTRAAATSSGGPTERRCGGTPTRASRVAPHFVPHGLLRLHEEGLVGQQAIGGARTLSRTAADCRRLMLPARAAQHLMKFRRFSWEKMKPCTRCNSLRVDPKPRSHLLRIFLTGSNLRRLEPKWLKPVTATSRLMSATRTFRAPLRAHQPHGTPGRRHAREGVTKRVKRLVHTCGASGRGQAQALQEQRTELGTGDGDDVIGGQHSERAAGQPIAASLACWPASLVFSAAQGMPARQQWMVGRLHKSLRQGLWWLKVSSPQRKVHWCPAGQKLVGGESPAKGAAMLGVSCQSSRSTLATALMCCWGSC